MPNASISFLVSLLLAAGQVAAKAADASGAYGSKPNIVLIFTDDQGYADVGVYGATDFATPHLDRMATEGARFTDFYAAPICSASRASLMTGCYSGRVSIRSAIFPKDRHGLNPAEITVAEVLKAEGYRTACIGKWHLGHMKPMMPTRQGFDVYFGLPYSNDMNGNAANDSGDRVHNVPLMDGETIVEQPANQQTLTRRYTERAIDFIAASDGDPFFIYLAHTMPHTPLAGESSFKGRTSRTYGDVIEEIDWSVGEVLKALEEHQLDDNTLVVFTSDNGPPTWKDYDIRGSAEPFRGGKQSTFEGGMRVPMIARWPGQIPEMHVVSEVAGTIDLMPTLAALAGGEIPSDRTIDGKNIWPLLAGQAGARSPHEYFYYLGWGDRMDAVRQGPWKLHVPYKTWKGEDGEKYKKPRLTETRLYNLESDPSEKNNVASQHPEIVESLRRQARAFEQELIRDARPAGYFIYEPIE